MTDLLRDQSASLGGRKLQVEAAVCGARFLSVFRDILLERIEAIPHALNLLEGGKILRVLVAPSQPRLARRVIGLRRLQSQQPIAGLAQAKRFLPVRTALLPDHGITLHDSSIE
jgi:hypothetical protein